MSGTWKKRECEMCHASRARLIAYDVVSEIRRHRAFAHNVLDARLAYEKGLPPEERAFAITLVLGVTQTAGTLDEVITSVLNDSRDVQPDVWDALRISTYEILFLDKDPYAAVDQGVELVRSFNPRAKNLANAVLRRVSRVSKDFPFGDPDADLSAFARSVGFPLWLAELLVTRLGKEKAQEFMRASNEPAPVFMAVNLAKAGDREVFETLRDAGAEPETYSFEDQVVPGCFLIKNSHALSDGRVKHLFQTGKVLVSDAASQYIAAMAAQTAYGSRCREEDDEVKFLEIGAGRATKTILLQSQSKRIKGRYLSMTCIDNQDFKVNLLRKRLVEYGLPKARAKVADGTKLLDSFEACSYDAVFLDAPCTGIGTLRRHPEIRWRVDKDAILESAKLQSALLSNAAEMVKPGGVLVYATCTVTYEENVGVVKTFLETDLGSKFRVAPINGKAAFVSELSHGKSDAHFAVRMVRLS